jgi:hypothetical protein
MSDELRDIDPDEIVKAAELLTKSGLGKEIAAMNERIQRRREQAPKGRPVPIVGPGWAAEIVDVGREVLAIHVETGEVYPLDVHSDLSIEEHLILVLQRMIIAGASEAECIRCVRAFGVPGYVEARVVWQLKAAR